MAWAGDVQTVVEDDTDSEHAPSLLCPKFFPPHHTMRKRTRAETFSEYWIVSASGERFVIPKKMIVRDYNRSRASDPALQSKFLVDDVINPALVIVLCVRDVGGVQKYAWYKSNECIKNRLERMGPLEVCKLHDAMEQCPVLCESSLCNDLLDCSLHVYSSNNESNVTRLIINSCKSTIAQFKKHKSMHATLNGVFKLPDQSTLAIGDCQICMKDGSHPLYPTSCCGEAGAMCADCMSKMKHLCPICDREFINAYYRCAGCTKDLAFSDFGFPCIDCNKCVLCAECYNGIESCQDCERGRLRNVACKR